MEEEEEGGNRLTGVVDPHLEQERSAHGPGQNIPGPTRCLPAEGRSAPSGAVGPHGPNSPSCSVEVIPATQLSQDTAPVWQSEAVREERPPEVSCSLLFVSDDEDEDRSLPYGGSVELQQQQQLERGYPGRQWDALAAPARDACREEHGGAMPAGRKRDLSAAFYDQMVQQAVEAHLRARPLDLTILMRTTTHVIDHQLKRDASGEMEFNEIERQVKEHCEKEHLNEEATTHRVFLSLLNLAHQNNTAIMKTSGTHMPSSCRSSCSTVPAWGIPLRILSDEGSVKVALSLL